MRTRSIGGRRYAKGDIEIPEGASGVDLRESEHAHDWMRRRDDEERRTVFSEMDDEELEAFEEKLDEMLADAEDES